MFSVVVLPAPLGPRNPKISPSFTLKLIPSTALTFLSKILVSSLTSMVLILFVPYLVTDIQKDKNLLYIGNSVWVWGLKINPLAHIVWC